MAPNTRFKQTHIAILTVNVLYGSFFFASVILPVWPPTKTKTSFVKSYSLVNFNWTLFPLASSLTPPKPH